jgi:predicted nicotinamide N-methyase
LIESIEIERPEDAPSLLQGWCNRADAAVLIPYWAELWPAARAIARCLVDGPPLDGQTVLDLGCGLGLTGVAAGLRGAHVTFADNHPDALDFARRNAAVARLPHVSFLKVDWRDSSWARSYDLVLGGDVIYDRSEHEPMVGLLERLLSGGGRAWLGDPSRESAKSFLEDWTSLASRTATSRTLEPQPGEDVTIVIHELRLSPDR